MGTTVRIANIRRVARHQKSGTCYAPVVVRDGDRELLYSQGGWYPDSMFPEDAATPREFLSKFDRSGDPICVWERPVGGIDFSFVCVAVHAHSPDVFPWMTDEAFLRAHPESYIGSTGGPCVYKDRDGLFHMWFAATVAAIGADPSRLDDANYMANHTPTEARDSRQFTIRHAVSDDGIHWRRRSHNRKHENVALRDAALYFGRFEVREHWGVGGECGVSSVWTVPGRVMNALIVQCFFGGENPTGDNQKNGLVIYNQSEDVWSQWARDRVAPLIPNGEIADWYTKSQWTVGNPFAHIIDAVIAMPEPVAKARAAAGLPVGAFIATAVPGGAPEIAISDDEQMPLTAWAKFGPEPIGLPFAIAGITNFRLSDDGARCWFSSNDAYLTRGGEHGTSGSDLFGASDIYEADVIWGNPPVKKIVKRRAAGTVVNT